MKKLLFLLFITLLTSKCGFSQVDLPTNPESKLDTIKVFYLMSDTSDYSGFKINANWAVYGQDGYEVVNSEYVCCDPTEYMVAKFYWQQTHLYYLDYNKVLLPKNIVIWQAR